MQALHSLGAFGGGGGMGGGGQGFGYNPPHQPRDPTGPQRPPFGYDPQRQPHDPGGPSRASPIFSNYDSGGRHPFRNMQPRVNYAGAAAYGGYNPNTGGMGAEAPPMQSGGGMGSGRGSRGIGMNPGDFGYDPPRDPHDPRGGGQEFVADGSVLDQNFGYDPPPDQNDPGGAPRPTIPGYDPPRQPHDPRRAGGMGGGGGGAGGGGGGGGMPGGRGGGFPIVLGAHPYLQSAFSSLFTPDQIAKYGHGPDLHYNMDDKGNVVTTSQDWGAGDYKLPMDKGGGGGGDGDGDGSGKGGGDAWGKNHKEGDRHKGFSDGQWRWFVYRGGKWVPE